MSTNSGSQENLLGSARENQTASDILSLLARELTRLAQSAGTDTAVPVTPTERPRKRKWTAAGCSYDFADDDPALPERDQLERIVTAYFETIHPWIPPIHRARLLADFLKSSRCDKSTVILHAMVIAAAIFVSDSDVDSFESLQARRKMILCQAMDTMSLENL